MKMAILAIAFLLTQLRSSMTDSSCSDGTCTHIESPAPRRGQGLLQTRFQALKPDGMDDVSDAALLEHTAKRGRSCLDSSVPDKPFPEDGHKGNPYGANMVCRINVGWLKSEFMQNLFDKYNKDGDTYTLKMCWDKEFDPEKRWFPWFYTNTGDFKRQLVYAGSTIICPMDLMGVWMDGFHQVVPEALDSFARMGEIDERKIIPKFMLYGWSKGAMGTWKIGIQRSDIVQGSALLHGCVSPKKWDDTYAKRTDKMSTCPHLMISSPNDGFVDCTWKDTEKHYKKHKGYQGVTLATTPCGHHPDSCFPACDLNLSFIDPFWAFVKTAYEDSTLCNQWTSIGDCQLNLCLWDSEFGACTDAHPVKMTPSCERFCEKQLVDSCGDQAEPQCSGSYVILPVEVANAKGIHSKCEWTAGQCVPSGDAFQCFFQDQCATTTTTTAAPTTAAPTMTAAPTTTAAPRTTAAAPTTTGGVGKPDPSKCLEKGQKDDDCCALPDERSCADGYVAVGTGIFVGFFWEEYSCFPPNQAPASPPSPDACLENGSKDSDCCAMEADASCVGDYIRVMSGKSCWWHYEKYECYMPGSFL